MELLSPGDEQVDGPRASSDIIPPGELTICFACGSPVKILPPGLPPFAMGYVAPINYYHNIWAGYPLMQHTIGAAGAGSTGLMTGVDMNVGPPAFNFTARNPVQLQSQGSSHVAKKIPVVRSLERSPDLGEGCSTAHSGAGNTSKPKRKRPKQVMPKCYSCPFMSCSSSMYDVLSPTNAY